MNLKLLGYWAAVGLVASCASRVEIGSDPHGATGGQAGSSVDIGVGGRSGGVGPGGAGGSGGVIGVSGGVGGSGGHFTSDGGAPLGGFNAGGSVPPIGPVPGDLNTSCIPGGLAIEAQGTVAQAEVRTLDRCSDGLSCNSAKICVPAPACPARTGGDCVVYVGSAAGGSASVGAGNTGGSGGGNVGSLLPAGVAIAGLAADDSKLYFIDYGTRDALGNYKNDGALGAYTFQSATISTLTTQLTGPVALGITTSHAYVALDGAPLDNNPPHRSLVRVPLSGGTPELVRDNAGFNAGWGLIGVGSTAFWSEENATYAMAESGSPPTLLFPKGVALSATDGQYLYYADCELCEGRDISIWRTRIVGGTPQRVVSPTLGLDVNKDFLYGAESVENGGGLLLDRVPVSGGTWQRVRALGAGDGSQLRMAGDRYFLGQSVGSGSVLTAVLDTSDPPTRVLERKAEQPIVANLWVGTSKVLYWSDGRSIYSRTFDPLP